jgi:hypothetical protein
MREDWGMREKRGHRPPEFARKEGKEEEGEFSLWTMVSRREWD